jgi:phosphatidylglycerophosphatase A
VGSFVALALYWICPGSYWLVLLTVSFGLFFFGVWCATTAEKQWGHDNGKITIDEAVGMLIALIALPKTLVLIIIAFITFRFFDIVKLFPAGRAERLPRGWGIMMDDVVAGIYANIITQLVNLIL